MKQTIEPSNTLFIRDLPPNLNENFLALIFQQVPGYREVRVIPFKKVAFIEFEDEQQATYALSCKK